MIQMRNLGPLAIAIGLCFFQAPARAQSTAITNLTASGGLSVDFRYAPRNWQTAICLPDDWQKSLVAKNGALLYDYPGKGLACNTVISFSVSGQTDWVRQELVSPRVPIVRTVLRSGDLAITQEAFAVAQPIAPSRRAPGFTLERLGSDLANRGWATPPAGTDPAFANIALGRGEPIRYRFQAKAGRDYFVAFGLCEGYHRTAGQRVLALQIEGKTVRTVDMVGEKGQNRPAVFLFPARDLDGDGWIQLAVSATSDSADKNAILNTLWVFQGPDSPVESELLAGGSHVKPLVQLDCSQSPLLRNRARQDLVTMQVQNRGAQAVSVSPQVTIQSKFPVVAEVSALRARIGAATELVFPHPVVRVEKTGDKTILHFAERELASQGRQSLALGVIRGQTGSGRPALDLSKAPKLRARAEDYWKRLDLPYGRLNVPDPGVQALLDSSIRNIYQAREIKNGLPAFQVGPTCYRGLWVVDGSFLMEAVTFLGRAAEARNGITYLMSFQKPDGSFMLIDGHYKETGIVLWAIARHAQLTGDRAWLESVWPRVERGFEYIRQLRHLPPADAPNAGLVPAGFSDGGLAGKVPEYTNPYWTLAGLRAAIQAAHWLGHDQEAADWQKEYEDFFQTFQRAARRDMRVDRHGNKYLPIRMQPDAGVSPQKAQWAFLHAVFPGKVFSPEDALVRGNMAMLQAVESEGLVLDTGWVKEGLWNYFGSFYAHAWLWLGQGAKAAETLYAFGNHASPLLVWREEQMPVGCGEEVVGDMPHNWASAEFIRLVRHSLLLERGQELHLLEGMPRAWAQPGALTSAKEIATEFGPVSLEIKVARDGQTATVKLSAPTRTPPTKVVLHLDGWSGGAGQRVLPSTGNSTVEVKIRRDLP